MFYLTAHGIFKFRKAGISKLSAKAQDRSRRVGDLRGKTLNAHVKDCFATFVDEFQDIQFIAAQALDDIIIQMQSNHRRSPFRE